MGQFSARGGILDFFPPHTENPIRVEFWGDEPDTISYFDIATQRRIEEIDSASITPAVEVIFDSGESLAAEIQKIKANLKTKSSAKAITTLERDIDRLLGGAALSSNDRYLPICFGGKPGTLLDFAPDALLFVSEPSRVRERAKNTLWQHGEDLKALLEDGVLCKGLDRFYLDNNEFGADLEKRGAIFLDTFIHTFL